MSNRTEDALIALRQILRATEINSRNLAKSSGLTPSQHIMLQVLSKSRRLTPSAIAKEVSLSQATVTALIDKLAARGLIRREKDIEDKRRVFIELTSEGDEVIDSAPGILQERFENRFAKLADWEQAFLVAALERTASILDAEELDAAPVLDVGLLTTTDSGSETS